MSARKTNAAREREAALIRWHDEHSLGSSWYAVDDAPCPMHGEMHVCASSSNGVMACACGAVYRPLTIGELINRVRR